MNVYRYLDVNDNRFPIFVCTAGDILEADKVFNLMMGSRPDKMPGIVTSIGFSKEV